VHRLLIGFIDAGVE